MLIPPTQSKSLEFLLNSHTRDMDATILQAAQPKAQDKEHLALFFMQAV